MSRKRGDCIFNSMIGIEKSIITESEMLPKKMEEE